MGSHASQLAKSVCIYSPWQFLYWYDRPEGSPGSEKLKEKGGKALTGDEPELKFFDAVPTVWDDTRVIESEPGQYGTIARRSGEDWFIGSINGAEQHTVKIPMDFLDKGEKYTAVIYSDDPAVQTRTHVKIERKKVDKQSVLIYDLKPNTGLAIRIVRED
jgi:alpha-glucosidase